jgi:hypothetical protein
VFYTAGALGAGWCQCFTPPRLLELAGVSVLHRWGSWSWQVSVFHTTWLLELVCVSVCTDGALGAGGCQCFTLSKLLELVGVSVCTTKALGAGGCQCFTPPGLLELVGISVYIARALGAGGRQCLHHQGSWRWRVSVFHIKYILANHVSTLFMRPRAAVYFLFTGRLLSTPCCSVGDPTLAHTSSDSANTSTLTRAHARPCPRRRPSRRAEGSLTSCRAEQPMRTPLQLWWLKYRVI